jgi:hypothetical protein
MNLPGRVSRNKIMSNSVICFLRPAFPFFEPPLPICGINQALCKPQIPPELQDIAVEPPSFLRCPFFESAAKTFQVTLITLGPTRLSPSTLQDHLYSGWFAPKHLNEIEKYREGVREAFMHAPWKDSTWTEQVDEGDLAASAGLLYSALYL